MAHHMQDWLAPMIERDLKEGIEWRRLRNFSDKDFSNIFTSDGSNLSIRNNVDETKSRVVQILEISPNLKNFKCQMSDGYTTIRARLTSSAVKSLEEDEKDASYLQPGMLVSIPKVQIKVTTLGKLEERIQLQINHAIVKSSMRSGRFGQPKDVQDHAGIQRLMQSLSSVSRETTGNVRSSAASGSQMGTQPSLWTPTQRSQNTHGDSQVFATQAPIHVRRPKQAPGAVNLAGPVAPSRTTSEVGSLPTNGKSGLKTAGPLALLHSMHSFPGHSIVAHNNARDEARKVAGGRTFQHEEGTTNQTRDGTASRLDSDIRNLGQVDLTESHDDEELRQRDDRIEDVIGEDMGQVNSVPAAAEGEANDTALKDAPNAEREVEVTHEGAEPEAVVENMQSSSRVASPELRTEHHSAESGRISSAMNGLQAPITSLELSWHGISQLRRSHCIVPEDQQALLDKKESWNPPAPGQQYPAPNIPYALLERFERALREPSPIEQAEADASTARQSPENEELPRAPSSSRTPASSEERDLSGWEGTSPIERHQSGLPPDSSAQHPTPRKSPLSANVLTTELPMEEDLSPDSPSQDQVLRSVELSSSPRRPDSSPSSQHDTRTDGLAQSSNMVSSAVDPFQRQPNLGASILHQPSTLSQSNFRSPVKRRPGSRSSEMSHSSPRELGSESRKQVPSTYTPAFQSAQVPQTPNFLDGTHSNKTPADHLHASDANRMAEEQLQQEFRESTGKATKILSPSTKRAVPSSPLDRPPRQYSDDEMDLDGKVPPQVLGKRMPTSPIADRQRPAKSRFGFSQEDAVSQDPARVAAEQRRSFLAARKLEHRDRTLSEERQQISPPQDKSKVSTPEPLMQPSSSPPTSARSQIHATSSRQGNKSQQHFEGRDRSVLAEDANEPLTFESLHRKFCAEYNEYHGNIKHFTNLLTEIDGSRNPLHQFLWDDYVIRNKTDYVTYSMDCLESGERPLAYEIFYTRRIKQPLYTRNILDSDKLEVLFAAQPRSDREQPSPKNRGRDSGRPPSRGFQNADRYVPSSRSVTEASPAPSTAGAAAAQKRKNQLVMMRFDEGPGQRRSSAKEGNAFGKRMGPPPKAPKDYVTPQNTPKFRVPPPAAPKSQVPKASAPPAPADDAPRRSLSSHVDERPRGPSGHGNGRLSSASDSRRSSIKRRF